MPRHNWRPLLAQWSAAILSREFAGVLHPLAQAVGWLEHLGATAEALEAAEDRLGRSLPASYRALLQISDGRPMVLPLLGWLWPWRELTCWLQRIRA